MEIKNEKGNGTALIPFLIFIAIYLGAGLIMQSRGVEMAFYKFPAVVAIFIATIIAFIMFKGSIEEKFRIFAKGAGNEDMMTMLMIFLLAGAFSAVAGKMGGVDATVNMGLAILPAKYITAGVFIIAAFLSLATGTSMGTVGAIAPIALGLVDKAGLSMPLVMAACLTGALFGDNLSMISDTTIAATRTQGVDLKDKFRANFAVALPAAVITIILLVMFGSPDSVVSIKTYDFNFVKVLPYIFVLVLALMGLNVFLVLVIGIFSAGIIGIAYGDLTMFTFAQEIWNGFQSMIEVFLLSMFCGGIAEMTKHYGGITWLLNKISRTFKGKKSAQLGIATLVGLTDIATANNTVSIIVNSSIAKDVSRKYKIDPRKTASILDVFSCVLQGFLPYGAQFLLIASLTEGRVSPIDVIPYNWYLMLLAACMILSFFMPKFDTMMCRTEWDWETNKPKAPQENAVK